MSKAHFQNLSDAVKGTVLVNKHLHSDTPKDTNTEPIPAILSDAGFGKYTNAISIPVVELTSNMHNQITCICLLNNRSLSC